MTARYSLPPGRAEATRAGLEGIRARMGPPLEQRPRPSQLPAAAAPASSVDGCIAACNAPFLPLPCSRPLALSAALRIVMTSVHGVHPCNARARHSHLRPCLYLVLHCTHTSRLFSLRCNDFDRHVRRRTHAPCLSAAGGPLEPGLSAERWGVQQRRQGRRGVWWWLWVRRVVRCVLQVQPVGAPHPRQLPCKSCTVLLGLALPVTVSWHSAEACGQQESVLFAAHTCLRPECRESAQSR